MTRLRFPEAALSRAWRPGVPWLIFICAVVSCDNSSPTASESGVELPLTVTKAGDGSGIVTSNPVGLECGTTCVALFEDGTVVTLTAGPSDGSEFAGWGGACAGPNLTCAVTVSQARSVTATFNAAPPPTHALAVTKAGDGSGLVTSNPVGLECGTSCVALFEEGTVVTLTASPSDGSEFAAWGGACTGSELSCAVAVTEASFVTATFSSAIAAFVHAFQTEFALTVPRPALVRSGYEATALPNNHNWISVAHVGSRMYRLKGFPDGRFDAHSRDVIRPEGSLRVVVVAVDYGNTNIGDVLHTGWVSAQNSINQKHASFAQQQGLEVPIVTFVNSNILASAAEIVDPRSRANVVEYLAARGITQDDFDILVSLDINAVALTGGFAVDDFVYMGCYFCTSGMSRVLSPGDLSGLASAIYHHEVGHIWGWEHDWTNCSVIGNDSLCRGFITAPELFGWTDADGDGIPEILDPTPYGR